MSKLVYGKKGQVVFDSEQDKQEAVDYLVASDDVEFRFESNEQQGAWASEKRIHFYSEEGVPAGLRRNWTAGTGRILGRINAGDFYDEVKAIRDAQ
ncbi:hypothetical protein ACNPON_09490 [Glutamicibacter sp. AGC13]